MSTESHGDAVERHKAPLIVRQERSESVLTPKRHNRRSTKVVDAQESNGALELNDYVKAGGGGDLAMRARSVSGGSSISKAELEAIRVFQDAAVAENTRRSYKTDWEDFSEWCQRRSEPILPANPLTVAAYLTWMANILDEDGRPFYAPGTVSRRLSSINKAHQTHGLAKPGDHPDVAAVIAGIRRKRARPAARKAPLLLDQLRWTVEAIDQTSWPAGVIGQRDAAILVIGMVGAFRRSEIAALRVIDVRRHPDDGLHVSLVRSKTDQEARGFTKALPFGKNPTTCPPCAFARWVRILAAAGDDRAALMRVVRETRPEAHVCREPLPELQAINPLSPLFRPVTKHGTITDRHVTGQTVNDLLRRRVAAIELDSAEYGGHSLRAGFITQAFRDGATHHEVMRQSGHRDYRSVDVYSRERDPLKHNAVGKMDL